MPAASDAAMQHGGRRGGPVGDAAAAAAAVRRTSRSRARSPIPTRTTPASRSRLAALAAMLGGGLPLRCVALNAPGDYDTHDSQPDGPGRGPEGDRRTALLAFQRDLEARGLADRVLVQVWSEFGRRGEENGSDGTDHGAAGLGLLIGTRARGQMVGEFPGLDRLDEDGNLRADVGLPRRLLRAARAVARHRRGRGRAGGGAVRAAGAGEVTDGAAAALARGRAGRCVLRRGRAGARPRRPPARLMVAARRVQPGALAPEHRARPGADPVPEPRRGPARPAPAAHRRGAQPRSSRARDAARRAGPARRAACATGRYRLWCSLPGHRALGMRAMLRVRRAGRSGRRRLGQTSSLARRRVGFGRGSSVISTPGC